MKQKFFLIWQNNLKIDFKFFVYETHKSVVKQLQIFNRHGIEVYSRNNYTNEWYGTSNDGKELPDATYYYVINFDSGKSRTGWIYINREN